MPVITFFLPSTLVPLWNGKNRKFLWVPYKTTLTVQDPKVTKK